jgi:thiamine biosynthesis protein ThiI
LLKAIGVSKLYIVKHQNNQLLFQEKCNRRYQCVLCKRMMLRVAELVAAKEGFDFLVTGENLGQVASQTLDNLVVLDSAVKTKILRPLLCMDKVETITIARKIGTFEHSISENKKCAFVPIHPVTKAKLANVEAEERKLDINEMANASIESVELITY